LNVVAARKGTDPEKIDTTNTFYGMALGGVVVAGAYGAGPISGGMFNPAITLGIATSDIFFEGRVEQELLAWCACFLFFELLGGIIAAFLFYVVRPEEFGREGDIISRLFSEFLGTYVFVVTVGLNVLAQSTGAVVSAGAALMSMSYAVGDISGAHFNPAVTIAVLASGRDATLNCKGLCIFLLVQVLAGVAGAFTYTAMYGGRCFGLGPKGEAMWVQVFIAEIVFTFLLCFAVLSISVSNKTRSPDMYGLVIGGAMMIGGFLVGGISGAVLNPAASIGIGISEASMDPQHKAGYLSVGAYVLLQVIGAGLAGAVFRVTHQELPHVTESAERW
jgi:aquaporin Z